jgi:hypothetical protein
LQSTSFARWRPLAIPDIEQLDISGGHRRKTLLGVLIGGGIGLISTAVYNEFIQSQCFNSCPDPVNVGLAAAAGGVALGSAFYFIKSERWLPIALPARRGPEL